MCGIAGFNFKVDKELVFDRLFHRGPDARGFFCDNFFSFFHTRLAIQDLDEKANQPFFYKNYLIVFNGEIYNHLELRRLINYEFQTNSDTETLLHLYLNFKEDMFKYIDGMFAFCIYDLKEKKLFLARDRTGKKPLYIYQKGKRFGFGSEINVFKFLNLEIDEEDIKLFLSTGFCESGFKEVKEFPPGCYGYFDKELKIEKYFEAKSYFREEISFEDGVWEVEENLKKAIQRRILSSDVEVGAFLSGGIDSSLICAMASKEKKLKVFTVRFEGSFDESQLASLVSRKYGLEHVIIDIKMDVKDHIKHILTSYGKPFFDSSSIPSFFVSKEARKYVKVVLSGDGADELFSGYRRYVPFYYGLDKIAKFLPQIFSPNTRGLAMFLDRLIRASKKEGIGWYNVLLNDLFEDVFKLEGEKIKNLDNFIKSIKLDNFNKLLYLDFALNLRFDLLPKIDIASMSNSLEIRSPFLAKELLELAPKIKGKIKFFKTKAILREIAKKYLPMEIVKAEKRGFEIPLTQWVNGDLNEIIMDYLNQGFYKNFVDERLVRKIVERKISLSEDKRAKILYLLFALEVWYENRFF